MSGHEFEKQVRQKLNDLKMTPTAEAWENIEQNLRERKRRPVAIFWLPLLVIGLAAGGYLFLNKDQNKVLSDKSSTHNVKVQPYIEDASGEGSLQQKINHPEGENKNPAGVAPGRVNASGKTLSNAPQEKKNASGEGALQQKINHLEEANNNPVGLAPGRVNASGKTLSNAPQEKKNASGNLSNRFPKLNIASEKFLSPSGNITIKNNTTSTPQASLSNKKPSPEKINKWSWGLSATAGASAVNEGNFLNLNDAQVEDVSYVAAFAPTAPYKPSTISPGFAYSAGAFVKRDLNKRFSLSLGVNYLQLNTRNKVGNEINGSQVVNNGSRGYIFVYNYFRVEQDNASEYRNKYHFIEVPMELHTKLNKSDNLPIRLNTGIAVSQLLKSNSLHFDGTTGVYYRNDKLLNQTQVAAKAGLSVGVFNKTTRPIWVGPTARYNVSKILQKDVPARKNFMSLGIDVKMFIK